MSEQNNATFTYGNSMLIASCRKVCRYIFEDFLFEVRTNSKHRRFDIYVLKSITEKNKTLLLRDVVNVEYFKKYWCESKQWNLIILEPEEAINKIEGEKDL